MKQGNSVARDLPPTGSEANTTIFVLYIGSRFPLSLSTIWGNHFHVKIPYMYIYDLEKPPPIEPVSEGALFNISNLMLKFPIL